MPERYQAFRHGESEYYDLYRRLLDQPELFDKEPDKAITKYFEEVAIVRRFVRKAETDSTPSLDDVRPKPDNGARRPPGPHEPASAPSNQPPVGPTSH